MPHDDRFSAAGDTQDVIACFDHLPAFVFGFSGPDHRIVAMNRAAREYLANRGELLGRPMKEAVPELAGQELVERLDDVFATGQPVVAREWRVLVDRTGDGELDEVFADISLMPILGADGNVVGVADITVDVTASVLDRRRSEAAAAASERRYEAAHELVLALQRTLLSDRLPVLPGVNIAAHYLVAGEEQSAGGDWFDALPRDDGSIALVVGDVVGHGPAAAGAMGQLRAVLRERLLGGADLISAVGSLDRFAAHLPETRASTLCVVLLDMATGAISYLSCGHPPPLLVGETGARYLRAKPGGPLGVGGEKGVVGTGELRGGETLLLYSDGLVERRGRGLEAGLEALASVVVGVRHDLAAAEVGLPALRAERLSALTVERMTRPGYDDDVTMIVLERLSSAIKPLHLVVPAELSSLAAVRQEVGDWLTALGTGPPDVSGLQLAVNEALTNSIEHGYAAADGDVRIDAELDSGGELHITVEDDGRWRPPPSDPGMGGRGLMLIRGFSDDVVVDGADRGTRIDMRRRLHGSAVLGSPPGTLSPRPPRPTHLLLRLDGGDPPSLTVEGPVDTSNAAEVRNKLADAARSGAEGLILDFSKVSLLGSAAVRLLHELADEQGGSVQIVAPRGSIARQVIDLSGLADRLTVVDD